MSTQNHIFFIYFVILCGFMLFLRIGNTKKVVTCEQPSQITNLYLFLPSINFGYYFILL